MKKLRYKNIFLYSSLQFCGNIEEYFARNSKKLVVFIVMPRLKNKYNLVRLYKNNKLLKERKIWSSGNIFLYYFYWYISYIFLLLNYYKRDEKFVVIASHPISFFGMTLQKFIRRITFVYFIGDYFPGNNMALRLFEKLKKHYHQNIQYSVYLSDGINKKMNGKIVKNNFRKTIMWGIKPKVKKIGKLKDNKFSILFVGLVKKSQGIEFLLDFLKVHQEYSVKIIGICDDILYGTYQEIIIKSGLQERIFFPNKFFTDQELLMIAKSCHVGIALYDTSSKSPTYYTDPGKVKAYMEMGLPVIMTKTSGVAPYITKFKSGIVISRDNKQLGLALLMLKKDYHVYIAGVEKFVKYFHFNAYYPKRYEFLEHI